MRQNRLKIVIFAIILVALTYLLKLFFIQVIDSRYKDEAFNNAIERKIVYPYRGIIFDRNGQLLVTNTPVYDITVIPKKVKIEDTAEFCRVMSITLEEFKEKIAAAKKYSKVKPSSFITQLSNEDFAWIQDKLVDYPGFEIVARSVRTYPHKSMANALGYIGEINKAQIEKFGEQNYRSGDYIGISGIESKYEQFLRGQRGVKFVMVNVRGVEKGPYSNGKYDTLSEAGKDLFSGVDLELQKYAEYLIQDKVGSIIAIEPKTGEVLTIVSSPSYDPNMLRGKDFRKNYVKLLRDPVKPLFNRPLMAMYPPGSTFKLINALIGLNEGIIDTSTVIPCNRSIVNCHGSHSHANLFESIRVSCNPYYVGVFKKIINRDVSPNRFKDSEIGFDHWREQVSKFGVGRKIGIDLPNEKKGQLPTNKFYDKIYGDGHWAFSTIYSLGLGQGELGLVPIQLANLACIIANKGYYIAPHLIRGIGDRHHKLKEYTIKHQVDINPKHFDFITLAMQAVVQRGTATMARSKNIQICGKTGTAQNPHGKDNSLFIGFAPMHDPKIAICIVLENAGWGATAAAPMASLIIQKYLTGTIEDQAREDYVVKGNFIE